MGNSTGQEQLLCFLRTVKGERFDIAAHVYDIISQDSNSGEMLRYFLENADDIESSEETEVEQYFAPNMIQKLHQQCGQMIEGTLTKLVGEDLSEEKFYDKLWEFIFENNLVLTREEEKRYALYQIWMDGRTPYFHLEPGYRMDNEDFKKICLNNRILMKKMRFILQVEFEQKTERSSLILKELKSCKTKEEQIVILAQVLMFAENKGKLEILDDIRKKK